MDTYIEHFMYQGQVIVIGGAQKSKKSWLALNLTKSLVTPGCHFLGIEELKTGSKPAKVLYVQTEGSLKKWQERVTKVVGDSPHVKWWFKPGLKLENKNDFERISKAIADNGIEVLILDPYQRLTALKEDSASETAPVWDNIFRLTYLFPYLSIVILHHFGKDKNISDRFEALRGSSRFGGEVDGAIFIENGKNGESRIAFEFRDEEPLLTPDGKDVFELLFDKETGTMKVDESKFVLDKSQQMAQLVKERKEITIVEVLQHFGITLPTLNKWLSKTKEITRTRPGPGQQAKLVWKSNG